MNPVFPACAVGALLLLALPVRVAPDYSIQKTDAAPPKELHDSIRKLLDTSCIRLQEGDEVLLKVWLRSLVPVKATEAQVMNGLTYREVPSSTLIGMSTSSRT